MLQVARARERERKTEEEGKIDTFLKSLISCVWSKGAMNKITIEEATFSQERVYISKYTKNFTILYASPWPRDLSNDHSIGTRHLTCSQTDTEPHHPEMLSYEIPDANVQDQQAPLENARSLSRYPHRSYGLCDKSRKTRQGSTLQRLSYPL